MSTNPCLGEDGLALAAGTEVALEALAETRRVVADTTARAVTAEVVALTKEHISTRRALFQRAVWATGTKVTDTADVFVCVPRVRVGLGGFVRKLFLLDAAATVVAVGRADSALAGLAVVVVEALALASLAVTCSFHGALHHCVSAIVGSGVVNPGLGLWAGADGAVVLGPGGVRILRARVACALIVVAAGAMATAPVGAVCRSGDDEAEEGNGFHHCV